MINSSLVGLQKFATRLANLCVRSKETNLFFAEPSISQGIRRSAPLRYRIVSTIDRMDKPQGANRQVTPIITSIDFVLSASKIRFDRPVICQCDLSGPLVIPHAWH